MNEQTKPDTRAMVQEMAEMVVECPDCKGFGSPNFNDPQYDDACECDEGTVPLLPELDCIDFEYDHPAIVYWALIKAALRMGWDIDLAPGIVTIETDPDADLIIKRGDDPAINLICAMHEAVKTCGIK